MMNYINASIIRVAELFKDVDIPKSTPDSAKIQSVMTWVFVVMGSLAVLMMTIAGFKYVMSMGDPQATKKAKDTILYAFIGLLIAVSSVAIIKFVLGNV